MPTRFFNNEPGLGGLSIGELRSMLDDRGVDYRDCLEKRELVQKLEEALADGRPLVRSSGATRGGGGDGLSAHERSVISTFEDASQSVACVSTNIAKQAPFSMRATEVRAGAGSGFIWDADGHIVTNFHVVSPEGVGTSSVTVTVQERDAPARTFTAKLVGAEPEKDIAVLKLVVPPGEPKPNLRPIDVGSSAALRVGQSVLAIGNPFGLDNTLSTGVVSALGREVDGVGGRKIQGCVQTDAAINPGNSGGPLMDLRGRLIGVNTAIFSPSGSSAGIGFAVPSDTVRRVVNQIIRYGRASRPSLGAHVADDQLAASLAERAGVGVGLPAGVVIIDTLPGSPAERAGLRGTRYGAMGRLLLGDTVTRVGGTRVATVEDLLSAIEEYELGASVELEVVRGGGGALDIAAGAVEKVTVTLDTERPQDPRPKQLQGRLGNSRSLQAPGRRRASAPF